jgi:2-polyprenyl-3-methyl-5-hydroxy-6-metoxy-1,4-benzoquinol methylase
MNAVATLAPAAPTWRLRYVPCNLCGSTAYRQRYASRLPDLSSRDIQEIFACTSSAYGECGPIVECTSCGFIYQNPQPDPDSLLGAYEDVVDLRYEEEREGRVHTFARAIAELEEFVPAGCLLDVGSHVGVSVEVARERGWNAQGVEPSRWAASMAANRGLPVTCGTLADLPKEVGDLDAVTIWDVIEHLADPSAELRRVHRLLRPGGVLAISTMDVDARVARLLGRNWPWYMQMHLFYFSRKTLSRLVEQAGFEVVEIRRHRRVVRVAYLISRLERRAGPLSSMLRGLADAIGLSERLVTVDLGDIITLFARKRDVGPVASTNGYHPR